MDEFSALTYSKKALLWLSWRR